MTLNRHTVRERLLASTMIGGLTLLASLSAAPAFAADALCDFDGPEQEVVVTGSRIPHPGLTSVSPLSDGRLAGHQASGQPQNVEDLIVSLSQAFANFCAMESNGATGTATVDLRNLDAKRTLVLIDGKAPAARRIRWTQCQTWTSYPQPSLTGWTSSSAASRPCTASDAIAGVVNFIKEEGLRRPAHRHAVRLRPARPALEPDRRGRQAQYPNPCSVTVSPCRSRFDHRRRARANDDRRRRQLRRRQRQRHLLFQLPAFDPVLEGARDFTAHARPRPTASTGTKSQPCSAAVRRRLSLAASPPRTLAARGGPTAAALSGRSPMRASTTSRR